MNYTDWNDQAKRLLKAELVKRGISNETLARRLNAVGIHETKAGIDSKISRGTFSAAFFLQCLTVIGCKNFLFETEMFEVSILNEPTPSYNKQINKTSL